MIFIISDLKLTDNTYTGLGSILVVDQCYHHHHHNKDHHQPISLTKSRCDVAVLLGTQARKRTWKKQRAHPVIMKCHTSITDTASPRASQPRAVTSSPGMGPSPGQPLCRVQRSNRHFLSLYVYFFSSFSFMLDVIHFSRVLRTLFLQDEFCVSP